MHSIICVETFIIKVLDSIGVRLTVMITLFIDLEYLLASDNCTDQ